VEVTVERITPDKAKRYLAANYRNRPLVGDHIKRLAAEMTSGRWKDNGDPIRFSGESLVDGQHRLAAIIQSGRSITAVVVRNLGEVFDTIDCGRKRQLSDVLAVKGESNYKTLAAALASLDRYLSGKLERGQSTRKSHQVYEELLEQHPDIRQCVSYVCGHRRSSFMMPTGSVAALYYLFSQKDAAMATEFMEGWSTGAGLPLSHPVLLLRDRLIKNTASKAVLTEGYRFALAVKAWNAVRERRTIKYLRYREEGDKPEQFPVIK
jgi:hypothetical protein